MNHWNQKYLSSCPWSQATVWDRMYFMIHRWEKEVHKKACKMSVFRRVSKVEPVMSVLKQIRRGQIVRKRRELK